MAFEPASRDWTMVKLPSKTTTAYVVGGMCYNDNTDNVPCASTTQQNIVGICQEAKAVGTSGTADLHFLTPNSLNSTFKADVSGTLTKAMEGDQFDFVDDVQVDQAASTYDAVTLVKFISASKGIFKLNYTTGIEN